MSKIKKESFKKVNNYYADGLSAREIASRLNVSSDAVYYFFRKYKIPRRSACENSRLLFERKKPSFKLNERLTGEDKILKIAGIMLYWAEGSKWPGEKIVDFANSDPEMIKIFLAFLRRIAGVNESKLRVYLYCYENQNPDELMKFWSKVTRISRDQFTKPYIRKDYKLLKTGKMKYGLIHVRYNDKKLLLLIKNYIDIFVKNF